MLLLHCANFKLDIFVMSAITSAKVVDSAVEVGFTDGKIVRFEDCWLRDHCRCSKCYHADTFQRALHILDIPDSKVSILTFKDSQIHITWDDSHETTMESTFLHRFEYKAWIESNKLRPVLWKGSEVSAKVARVPVKEFLNSVDGASAVFQSLLDYGVVLIDGVEPTLDATEVVCKALGGVQNTLFGAMWKFTTRVDHADTAYTNIPLAAHHDNTYFTEAAGLQVFHCLEHTNGKGGETILVDGFYGATLLKAEHPEDFKFLTEFHLQGQYIEEGHHHKNSAPVIILDDTGDLKQIRFNVYDRSPMAFRSRDECRAYYRSLRSLSRYYQDTDLQWQLKLEPGVVVAMDNFRVLHGRTGFSGNRVLGGSYVARSDWLDRARTLKLIQ